MRRNPCLRARLWGSLAAVIGLSQCIEGGFNQNERAAGDGDEGAKVGFGEIAIDPTGAYFVSRSDESLLYGDLKLGSTSLLEQLSSVERVAFAHEGHTIFVTSSLAQERGRLVRYDLSSRREEWSRAIKIELSWDDQGFGTYPWVDVLEDDSKVILTFADHVEVLDARDGSELFRSPEGRSIVDVDVTPDQQHLLITHDHEWVKNSPRTTLELRDLGTFTAEYIEVQNCADEVLVAPDGKHAFLAPTTCSQDPVSVVDLEQAKFSRNLPGFGPVALAPDGKLAIAFLDRDNLNRSLFDDPTQIPSDGKSQYHLMLIDTAALTFKTVELGDTLPRYAVAPNGQMLLIDAATFWEAGRIRVLDVNTQKLANVRGPDVRLENYVITHDSSTVFLLDQGLYRVALKERTAQAELLDFTPKNLNITPDDRTLVLREDDQTLWLYDVRSGRVLRSMHSRN
jgi:hypothetical protein